jgi:hypothetical protein
VPDGEISPNLVTLVASNIAITKCNQSWAKGIKIFATQLDEKLATLGK